MQTNVLVALISYAIASASAGAAFADATRAKGVKSPRPATLVAHPKGKYCVKTGRLIPASRK